jgi:tRNA (cmo5U34)-methyltransferase
MEKSVRELSFIVAIQIEKLLEEASFERISPFFSTTLFGGWICHA